MKKIILVSLFFYSAITLARITDDQVIIKTLGNKIEISTKPKFHLNVEAPASALFDDLKAIFKPNPKTEKLFVFLAPDKTKKAKLSFYVCDDKKTACEQHEKEINLISQNVEASKAESKKDTAVNYKSDKQTLLIFSAPWCPACLRMETETYPIKTVQAQFKKLNVKKINIDLVENFDSSEKFHVKAIPTLILLNKDGDEIYRWLDYQPAKKFAVELQSSTKSAISLAELEKKAKKGDASAISKRGMLSYIAYQCEDALKWWAKSKNETDMNYRLAAEIQCAEEKKPEDQTEALEKGIKKSTSKLDQLRWTIDLLEKKKENKSKDDLMTTATATIQELAVLTKNPVGLKKLFSLSTFGDPAGFETEEALVMKGRLYALLEKNTEKIESYEAIKANAEKRNISVDRPGEMLLAIAYLREADEKVRVQEMYQQLLNRYPDTYVYHEKYARYQLKNKSYDQALASINTALLYPEGNEPQLQLLKARILNEMKNKEQAIAVINEALKLENISHKKFKKTLAALEDLQQKLKNDSGK